jgi:anti-sigma regulatory factor (Ser/Thr protein kinase)
MGSEAVRSNSLPEYWAVKPGHEKRGKELISNPPEPEMTLEFAIEPKDYNKTGKASSEIKLFLKKVGVNPEILRRVAVASYEAEINVTAHSEGGKIYANIYQDYIMIYLEDEGPGIPDIEQAMIPGFSTADDLAREMGFGAGLGLPNIKKNCDVMYIRSAKGESTYLAFIIFFEANNSDD